jgi:DNA-binding SARP family transcriptional activator/tetratricopeptide (TPR) repeat protein
MPAEPPHEAVRAELLGGFRLVVDGREVADGSWPGRRARELVQLLALADGRALPRDEVLERLWPHLGADAAAANLRKAAHHARRALADPDAVVLRGGRVALLPHRTVETDAERFARDAATALRGGDSAACAQAAAGYHGDLLPDAPYEEWTQEPRRHLRSLFAELLRRSGQWERLAALDPTDELAHRELMRAALEGGRRHAAIRWYGRLRGALARELGTRPSPETEALYASCTASIAVGERMFVGRAVELARAAAALRGARDAEVSALLVRGPTGIGKSAFCRQVAARARDDGWRVVTVRATASGAPYGPIGAALEQLLADRTSALQALPARTRAVLAELTPLAAPAPPVGGRLTRHHVIAALRRVLALPAGAAQAPPTLVVVDDAHLADDATADVLHQLAATSARSLLVLLACRSEPGATRAARGLAELARDGGTVRIDLGPLDREEIAALVAVGADEPPRPEAVERIARIGEGNPFFTLELARALTTDTTGALPATVREAIAARFVDLDPGTVTLLATLAVSAEDLDLTTVLALTGLDEPAASAPLDAALHAGVLVVEGTRLRFRHELVRQALADDLPPHRRRALHRDAARRLADAGAAPELIAQHWLDGDRAAEAVGWLLAATRRAIGLGAFADALGHVDRLLEAAAGHTDGLCLRAEILDALGDSRAPAAYARAAVAAGEPEAQELRARQALAQLKASDPAGALRTLQGTRPRSPAGLLAQALTLSAAAAVGAYGDAEVAAAKADEAFALAVRMGDPGAILDATWARALAAHAKGELPARLREFLHATHELPDLAIRVFDGQLCVTERLLYGGLPYEEVIDFADALAAEAQRLGAVRGQAFALTLRGEAELLAGRLDEADRDFAGGARLHGGIGAVAGEALSLMGRAEVAVQRGRHGDAAPLLADALLMARESDVGHHTLDRIYGTMVRAAPDASSGVGRVREAETAIRGPAETCPTCRIAFVVPAAIAAARAGDLPRAHRYARDAEVALGVIALPPAWGAAVDEVRGWVARASGRRAAAHEHFRVAAEGFQRYGQPLDARRCAELAARG